MVRVLRLADLQADELTKLKRRSETNIAEALVVAQEVITQIQQRGDEALLEYVRKFLKVMKMGVIMIDLPSFDEIRHFTRIPEAVECLGEGDMHVFLSKSESVVVRRFAACNIAYLSIANANKLIGHGILKTLDDLAKSTDATTKFAVVVAHVRLTISYMNYSHPIEQRD